MEYLDDMEVASFKGVSFCSSAGWLHWNSSSSPGSSGNGLDSGTSSSCVPVGTPGLCWRDPGWRLVTQTTQKALLRPCIKLGLQRSPDDLSGFKVTPTPAKIRHTWGHASIFCNHMSYSGLQGVSWSPQVQSRQQPITHAHLETISLQSASTCLWTAG